MLDTAENGVWLPASVADRVEPYMHAATHRNLTQAYYAEVDEMIRAADTKEKVLDILDYAKQQLLDGAFPQEWSTVPKGL